MQKTMKGRRGGRVPSPPAMHIHQPHLGQVVSTSASGRTATVHAHVVNTQPRAAIPSYIQEDVETNAAVENWDFSYDLGDTTLLSEVYENSDYYPMLTWANKHQDKYLDEMLQLEGHGYPALYSTCRGCGGAGRAFRCEHQTCYGASLFCMPCIVERHAVLPTHWIQEWNGNFFMRRSLKDLSLVVQLGHPAGSSCMNSAKAHKDFQGQGATATNVVIRLFRPLNCLGKVSAHDFLRSLELLTNNDGLDPVPDRRWAFRHIVWQCRITLMMKRAGRGHDQSGVHGTSQGELALQCRACPQAGMNLPDGWNNINWDAMQEDLQYKYFLFLAQDCNFQLINRNVSSAAKDPILHDGCGYFVNNAKYVEFLRAHVTEEEISTCSGFQVMFLANRKHVKGLRTTGVGGVTCTRHNMWRPNGIGDLQLGERQCNMDFILVSALLNIIIFYLILSYDIVCQYGKNFWTRMPLLPDAMHPPLTTSDWTYLGNMVLFHSLCLALTKSKAEAGNQQ
ncbi:hypothetical protein C8F01DRAFT_1258577 [Mycena amicta]|nr:hypothetical protein C8F01DRAFT_1258577 [Mycena amicta]